MPRGDQRGTDRIDALADDRAGFLLVVVADFHGAAIVSFAHAETGRPHAWALRVPVARRDAAGLHRSPGDEGRAARGWRGNRPASEHRLAPRPARRRA